ncbi:MULTISPECIES: acyl-CoA dehydrogenase family protein [Rhodococcus]|uniref:Acyl-CoA/acyl-ACP dehydrogenase n=3 Tax=Rhodococcus TaxID=1827 RepID=N1ME07_9NOCA|nr:MULTISPECIES: acyl-CoA dehydrogenase family protein [Rhodococcus]AAQ73463.1 acyl-CoA dehydrogenase [Rhodococcus sp. NCIMB 9784]ANZ26739.1 butyryl-CoA dehydrogenase [Rhodococcus sp. WB1]MBC2591781.1 acyl-CoA/acyl-ACP dehydrogenase [Rhodococcus aetherivorans]PND51163.1 acyl-CoA dehydrogenase [Rhodococcus sp. ENV425]QIX48982.1 acyl-CoA/acyl-ACP dehydrogenase [Rhodococcus sp. DMU1]
MDFRFTDEQQMWHETVHAFMEREVGIEYIRKHDEAREFPEEAYQKIADRGWLGLLIPEQYGGLEADPVMYAIFCEAIAKYSLDFAAAIMTSMFTATNIAFHGTDEQRQKYLPDFMEGKIKFSISITEPNAGSDAAGLRTRAVQDGDSWIINGNKVFCSGAHLPGTVIAVMARTSEDKHKGLSMILVPNTTEGVDVRKLDTIVRRSLGTTEIFFTDARVPVENIIGQPGDGWTVVGSHLEWERLSLAATYVGNARTALDDTIRYTKDRTQFGRPLSSFQVLKHRMAEDECEVEAARLLVYSAATKLARGEKALKEVSMAKVFAAKTAFRVATNGMQALGGYATLPEYDMERYFREAKHGMVGGGTNEIQHSIIAKQMGL